LRPMHDLLAGRRGKAFSRTGAHRPGKVLGSNPLGDVCLVKILDKDQWPSVCDGDSMAMEVGQTGSTSGFPGGRGSNRVAHGAGRVVSSNVQGLGMMARRGVFHAGPPFPGDPGRTVRPPGPAHRDSSSGTGPHRGSRSMRHRRGVSASNCSKADWDFLAPASRQKSSLSSLGEIQKAFVPPLPCNCRSPSRCSATDGDEPGHHRLGDGWVLTKPANARRGNLPVARRPDLGRNRVSRRSPTRLALLKLRSLRPDGAAWDERESPLRHSAGSAGGREGPVATVLADRSIG